MTEDLFTGRHDISRRSVLRLLGAGAGAAALAPGLAACGGGGSLTKGGPNTITYSVQSIAHQPLQPFLAKFKQQTGITVRLQGGPATDQDLLSQVIPAFNAGSSPYDVMDVGDPGCAALTGAGWLAPLDDVLTGAFWSDLTPGVTQAMKTWNQKGGKTYRVHHNWEIGYVWTRGDILKKNNLKTPASWEELVSTGKEIKAKTGAYALADAASKPGLTFVYLAYLTAQAGGQIYSFDEGTRQAFQFAHDLIYTHQLFPKDALTWTYDQLNAAYMKDQLLSMREWTFFSDVAAENKSWYDPDKVQIVAPPAGPAGSKTWAGGWGFAIPKASQKQEAAKKFVAYMSTPEVAAQLAQASAFFVTARNSIFDKLGDEGIVKHMKEYTDAGYVTPRPFHPQAAKAESVIDDIGQAYLTNQMDLNTAMEQGKKRIAALGA